MSSRLRGTREWICPDDSAGVSAASLVIGRRDFLKTAAGFCLLPLVAQAVPEHAAAEPLPLLQLVAREGTAKLIDGGQTATRIWGYNGAVPGPLIRVQQNELVRIRLTNQLPQPTSAHWHGLRITNGMDGVAELTQEAVQPGQSFDYEFRPPDAGTFWYHSHARSWEQVARGLYGVLIVDEPDPILVDQDLVFAIDDWLLDQSAQIHEDSLGSLHDWSHGGRLGQWLTVNGKPSDTFAVQRGQRIRMRMINSANSRTVALRFDRHQPYVIALDGQPVDPYELGRLLTIAPGQRVDLVMDMNQQPGDRAPIQVVTRREAITVAEFAYEAEVETAASRFGKLPRRLASNPLVPLTDLGNVKRVELTMQGGAMSGMRQVVFNGKQLDMEEMIRQRVIWAFNGTAGMPDRPLLSVRRGTKVIIDVRNDNRWPHAMHLHGHHFKVIRKTDQDLSKMPWRDTELVQARQKLSLVFVADNPGKWLFHCHMLEHQAAGMKTWIEVT